MYPERVQYRRGARLWVCILRYHMHFVYIYTSALYHLLFDGCPAATGLLQYTTLPLLWFSHAHLACCPGVCLLAPLVFCL